MSKTNNKRKKAAVAAITAAAILLAGTFAWTSISQTAKNEAVVDINPGARLHDDFDGTNKDVYVENFGDEETGVDIFARVRLDEYMEVGQDAGEDRDNADRRALPVVEGTDINDKSTWNTFVYGEETQQRAYAKYWTWDMGNAESHKPYYMPTFNKNKDSLVPDINGTYEGLNAGDIVHYDDYVPYDADSSITADAVYDWDLNTIDEVEEGSPVITTDEATPLDEANVLQKSETHDAQQITSGATIMTMAEWKALPEDQKVGPYWVYDIDGWAYWAQPIKPGETTGLLLDGIHMSRVPDDNWYYGINVTGQFVTSADISAFTKDGEKITDDALDLLSAVTGIQMTYTIEGPAQVKAGSTYTYTTLLKNAGAVMSETPTETWSISGEDTSAISINAGEITVTEDAVEGTRFTIKAEATLEDGRTITAEKEVTVGAPGAETQKFLTVKKAGAGEAAKVADGITIMVNPGEVYTLGAEGKTVTWSGQYLTENTLTIPDDMESRVTWAVTATDSKDKTYTLNFLCGPLYDEKETFLYKPGTANESEEDAVQVMVVADIIGNDGNPYEEGISITYWSDRYLPDGAEYYLTKTYNNVTQIVDRTQYGMSELEVLEGGEIRDGFAILLYIEPDTASGTRYDFNIAYQKDGKSYGQTATYTYTDNADGSITAGGNVTVTGTPAAYTKDNALAITFEDDAMGIAKYVTIDKTDAAVEPEYTVSVSAKDEHGAAAPTSECYFGTASENGQIKTYGFLFNKVSGYIKENDGGGYTKTYPTITYTVTVTYTGTDGKIYGNEATVAVGQ